MSRSRAGDAASAEAAAPNVPSTGPSSADRLRVLQTAWATRATTWRTVLQICGNHAPHSATPSYRLATVYHKRLRPPQCLPRRLRNRRPLRPLHLCRCLRPRHHSLRMPRTLRTHLNHQLCHQGYLPALARGREMPRARGHSAVRRQRCCCALTAPSAILLKRAQHAAPVTAALRAAEPFTSFVQRRRVLTGRTTAAIELAPWTAGRCHAMLASRIRPSSQ